MKHIKLYEKFIASNNPNKDYLDFMELLKKYDIPIDKYGTGSYKTLNHLYNEISDGETILVEENGELVRKVQFVGARIIYKNGNQWYRLFEAKQVFKDGRVRKRDHMPYSAAEKFKAGEDPKEVVIRGMKEEIGVDISIGQFIFYNRIENDNSDDYPGIKSFNIGYEFLVVLTDDQYNPDGYIERQSDKDVYFEWRKVSSIKESMSYMDLIRV